ncbi:hypothetical protein Pint_16901 [Pistacia integerrima]|uniref:Uncharacterized protein n=1 Tax=Pistacia integerrima TaxID=434235 RepID=A0ACC0ZBT1_9ROSI|nr:hypothetical protein Pint_16901 [Pistacia integerrima]
MHRVTVTVGAWVLGVGWFRVDRVVVVRRCSGWAGLGSRWCVGLWGGVGGPLGSIGCRWVRVGVGVDRVAGVAWGLSGWAWFGVDRVAWGCVGARGPWVDQDSVMVDSFRPMGLLRFPGGILRPGPRVDYGPVMMDFDQAHGLIKIQLWWTLSGPWAC